MNFAFVFMIYFFPAIALNAEQHQFFTIKNHDVVTILHNALNEAKINTANTHFRAKNLMDFLLLFIKTHSHFS